MFSVIYFDSDKGLRFSVIKTVDEKTELKKLSNVYHVDRFDDNQKVSIKSFDKMLGFKTKKVRG